LTGLAPNGGLYIPENIPSLPEGWKTEWSAFSFIDLSIAILSLYISADEISKEELRQLVEKSYRSFRHPDITPLKMLDDKTFVLELFHGPTFAFKDVALQLLGNLFEFFLLRRNAQKSIEEEQERITVVGATSGDTGRFVSLLHPMRVYPTSYSMQCCHLWSSKQGQRLDFHSASKGPCLPYPRSADDDCH
jgi:threonine synthase